MQEKKEEKIEEKSVMQNFEVNSPKDADRALQLLGVCEIDLGKLNARINRKIAKIWEELGPEIELLRAEEKKLFELLKIWAEENKDQLFRTKRSLDLNYGMIGFQVSHFLATDENTNWEKVLMAAKKLYPDYIIEKYELSKEALKRAPEKIKEKLGIHIETKDSFYASGKDGKKYKIEE